DKLDKATVQQAFVTEETHHCCRAQDSASTLAMATTTLNASCNFCGRSGHIQSACYAFECAQKQAKENVSKQSKKRTEKANAAKDSAPAPADTVTKFAGNASARLPPPSPMLTLIGLQTQAPLLT
ncbi:hypothetical protein DXG03_005784, partial [Asterophora parasitica]